MKQYRVVEVGTEKCSYFKVQEKGWFFWRTWRHLVDGASDEPMSVTTWFDTKEEAETAISKTIKSESEKPKKINRVVSTISAPYL